tara:strand:+ start:522 stop:1103 length:582 start_codon:yes stop_codon:yes gene_type:complete
MPEYSSNYTSGYVKGGINRYRRGNVAAKVAGVAGVALAGYGLFKGAQAIVRAIKSKHALNLKARADVDENNLPQTRINRRIARARIKGKDELVNKLEDKKINKAARQVKWNDFRVDWQNAMDANREELRTGIKKLNVIRNIKDKIHEKQRTSGKYEGMTRRDYNRMNREREVQEQISDADKIVKQQKKKSKRF